MNKFIIIVLTIITSTLVFAHGGRTNSSGCHNDNIRGGYHCHKATTIEVETSRTPSSIELESTSQACCKVCTTGKACGDSCISRAETCHKGIGCACDR